MARGVGMPSDGGVVVMGTIMVTSCTLERWGNLNFPLH
jgi:hypothetical protein